MHKIKISSYQLQSIKRALDAFNNDSEDKILEKYKVNSLEDLKFSDYEKIMDDLTFLH